MYYDYVISLSIVSYFTIALWLLFGASDYTILKADYNSFFKV